MSFTRSRDYDVIIVGAGPVGSLCAIAHARKGARVALLEANPRSSRRLAGEWLHPSAVRILRGLGIDLGEHPRSTRGRGFVVLPEYDSDPIVLPYADGSQGLSCEHEAIVSTLRNAVEHESDVDFLHNARVRSLENGRVTFVRDGAEKSMIAERIVGADGRASTVRRSLGVSTGRITCSWMVGVTARGVSLPLEGYGYVVLGGPGPVLMYQIGEDCVRIMLDVPLDQWPPRDRIGFLSEAYAGLMPEALQPAFVEALRAGGFDTAANEFRPRMTYGNPHRVLIGDAVGHYHPMTASGMTLGFGDALALAEGGDFRDFTKRRFRATYAPELLAMELYEVFVDHRSESLALRRSVYRHWRASSSFRDRTIRILACEETSPFHLRLAGAEILARTITREILRSYDQVDWRRARVTVHALSNRVRWLLRGARQLRKAKKKGVEDERVLDSLGCALLASIPSGPDACLVHSREGAAPDAGQALSRATARLLSLQGEDGAWEGEMVWCPMLTAQYVLLHYLIGRRLKPGRRRRVLLHFERTRLEGGAWGLHEHSAPHLFVTTLVYVAARLLGVERDDPLIESARRFLREEDVLGIPSWGKFWLALLNLYDWRGVNAILPELWSLPRWIPLHPANWYCHTRLIYMAMAVVYAQRFQVPVTPLIASLREELFKQPFADIDFSECRNRLRDEDLYAQPSPWLRAGLGFARVFERFYGKRLRARCVETNLRRIKWELRTTDYASISPVSGLINILALWLHGSDDTDCRRAIEQLDGWIWEDEEDGARVTGARSASWDTGLSLQALATVPGLDGVREAVQHGAVYLSRQQIGVSFEGFREAYRIDPKGGWCFPGGRHGWPVTDCTAEAVLGIIAGHPKAANATMIHDAVGFMLRGQNRDGGFGSYEARRSRIGLEWLNPAEMFGDSMTEHSYVECTASCIAALAACGQQFALPSTNGEVTRAISRAEEWLRRAQASDGSWRGAWGIQFIYGTMFGVRGLVAAGARPGDPALSLAGRWLLDRQRTDGGWGEHHTGCVIGRYVPHEESRIIQTAWALLALLTAGDSNWSAITRGVQFLIDTQKTDGAWPRQDMAGVFFRTALLEYVLYRDYFPLQALGLYEQRRRNQLDLAPPAPPSLRTPPLEANPAELSPAVHFPRTRFPAAPDNRLGAVGPRSCVARRSNSRSLADLPPNEVKSVVDQYKELHDVDSEGRKQQYRSLNNHYYDLVTDFYNFGWGRSFHFAPRYRGESFEASLLRHQRFLADKLSLRPGMQVLDVGCGVGGPMGNMARYSGASFVGININAYQIERAKTHTQDVQSLCRLIHGDFMHIPEGDCYDAAFTIQAMCHAPDKVAAFREVFRVLRPGAGFAGSDFCLTEVFSPRNAEHLRIKKHIMKGNGVPDIALTSEVCDALRMAGFELLEARDLAPESHPDTPWYRALQGRDLSFRSVPRTPIGRALTNLALRAGERFRLVPEGTRAVSTLLNHGADAMVEGGESGLFTPVFFFLARKPHQSGDVKTEGKES